MIKKERKEAEFIIQLFLYKVKISYYHIIQAHKKDIEKKYKKYILNPMVRVSTSLKFLIGASILFGYLSVLIYTPVHMIEMADMHMPMEHCPFAMNQHVICTMTMVEHMREWQSWLQNPLPLLTLLVIAAAAFSIRSTFTLSAKLLKLFHYRKRQRQISILLFLEQLFARGILNPKVY